MVRFLMMRINKNDLFINTTRKSNIELFRIITMLLIIACHYVHFGLLDNGGPIYNNPSDIRSYYLLAFGMWGQIGVNCFVFITGYYMCNSKVTIKRFLKIFLVVVFYNAIFSLFLLITGYYDASSLGSLIKNLTPIESILTEFKSCYLLFMLLIPFINIFIKHITRKQHKQVSLLLLLVYSVLASIPHFTLIFNYVSWFTVIYFVASYIRLYSPEIFNNRRFVKIAFVCLAATSILSVVLANYFQNTFFGGVGMQYSFVEKGNKLLAFLTSMFAFLFFKDLKIKDNKYINTISATTFGVLILHCNSETSSRLLWIDIFDNIGAFYNGNIYIHSILSVACVFIVCSIIDYLRIVFIERNFFAWFDKKNFKDPFSFVEL